MSSRAMADLKAWSRARTVRWLTPWAAHLAKWRCRGKARGLPRFSEWQGGVRYVGCKLVS